MPEQELIDVEMPDGTVVEGVPAGTSKAEVSRRYNKMRVMSAAPAAPVPTGSAASRKGFGESLMTGIPTSGEEAAGISDALMGKTKLEKVLGAVTPGLPLGKLALGYAGNVASQVAEGTREKAEASTNIAQGGPVMANLGKAAAADLDTAAAIYSPLGGDVVKQFGEQAGAENYEGAAGSAVNFLLQAMLLRGGGSVAGNTTKQVQAAHAAAAISDVAGLETVKAALPRLRKAATTIKESAVTKYGAGTTNLKISEKALADANAEFKQAFRPVQNMKVPADAVADRIKGQIREAMPAQEFAEIEGELNDQLRRFRRKDTLGDWDKLRMMMDSGNAPFYKKGATGRAVDMKKLALSENVEGLVNKHGARALREWEYDMVSNVTGQDISTLKNETRHLIAYRDAAQKVAGKLELMGSESASIGAVGRAKEKIGTGIAFLSPRQPVAAAAGLLEGRGLHTARFVKKAYEGALKKGASKQSVLGAILGGLRTQTPRR